MIKPKTISRLVETNAQDPAPMLIVLGLFAFLAAFFLPMRVDIQMLLGGLGFHVALAGIIVHATSFQNKHADANRLKDDKPWKRKSG
jgi:hypothetical protein